MSLFDHLKTTAAIAGCLYDYHQEHLDETYNIEDPAFRLVGGDVSGIQSYIFDVLSQQGKVAKRLRARAFFVQVISEIAAHKILHAFDLPLLNILSSAGGNFYILVPNLKESEKKVQILQKEFDNWMLENLNGELSISLASVIATGRDLTKFSEVLENLKKELSRRKYQPHKLDLVTDDKWKFSNFIRPVEIKGDERACRGCHHYPIVDTQKELCLRCLSDITIGERLPKKGYLAFYKNTNEADRDRFQVLNYSFRLCDQQELKTEHTKDAYHISALNNPENKYPGIGFKYLALHIPRDNNGLPLALDEITGNFCVGDKLLSYVKADVDDMGKIFRDGFNLGRPEHKFKIPGIKPSISRFCSLSRMLETFFAGYLQMRLEDDFKDIYTVFSGGDDFFVVGPWHRSIDFVKMMRKEFERFAGGNPDFTFSAGVILAKPHEPISFCAGYANDELEKSKCPKGKDKITLFDQTVGWEELNKILDQAEKVIGWLKEEPPIVSRGFIHNLRQYGEMHRKYKDTGETKELRYVPLLAYDIKRNLARMKQEEVYDWAVDLLPTIDQPSPKDNLPYLRTIMEYVLTYTRGGKGEEKV